MPLKSNVSIFSEGKTLDEIGGLARFAQRLVDMVHEGGFEASPRKAKKKRRASWKQRSRDEALEALPDEIPRFVMEKDVRITEPRKRKAKAKTKVKAKAKVKAKKKARVRAVSVAPEE